MSDLVERLRDALARMRLHEGHLDEDFPVGAEHRVGYRAAHMEIVALAPAAIARIEALEAVIVSILECDYDAIEAGRGDTRYGLLDCVDNDGKYYPSQQFHNALATARRLIEKSAHDARDALQQAKDAP